MEYFGKNGFKHLYLTSSIGAIYDSKKNSVVRVDKSEVLLASGTWYTGENEPRSVGRELASAAIADLDIRVLSSNERMYTIPVAVVNEAKRALEWRKEHRRGGTPVGMNTARTLAKGGQIGIKKVRHIAKYFPRHEVDKKGKGYKPGEDGYPSNGRIAWALWGGDAAKKWSTAIVERENKKSGITAGLDFFAENSPRSAVDYESFVPSGFEPEFFVRVRLDNGCIDRLYKVDNEDKVSVWDDGGWDDLGGAEHDFSTYDKSLDDLYDQVKRAHLPIDRESAVIISAMFDSNPFNQIKNSKINEEESYLVEVAIPEIDWEFLDGIDEEEAQEVEYFDFDTDDDGLLSSGFETDQDGNYTPEERSAKASSQVRDQLGRFAKAGTSVVINNNPKYRGKVLKVNPETKSVSVQLKNGQVVDVPADMTQEASQFNPAPVSRISDRNPLDFTGILGEPRVPIDQPNAMLPGRLPPLTAADTNILLSDWSSWVAGQRLSPEYEGDPLRQFIPKPPADINTVLGQYYTGAFNPDGTAKSTWNPAVAPNAYNDPLLRDWIESKYGGDLGQYGYPGGWYVDPKLPRDSVYSPENISYVEDVFDRFKYFETLTAAGKEAPLTPENSDVAPMYLAIVADDDPQAVLDLVALVPKNRHSTSPSTFRRENAQWVRDDKIAADLKSPTPPPVVVLDSETLADVVRQIDGSVEAITGSASIPLVVLYSNNDIIRALTSAGGFDRNRGNAEKLRRYWTIGPGGLKIRWNTPGDWTRCVRQLAKYLGPRARGYCQLRHKEMTGVYTGSKYNIGKKKKRGSLLSSAQSLKSPETVVSEFTLRARAESARSRLVGREGVQPVEYGSRFVIPLVLPENMESGDGRMFKAGSITIRDLPLPLMWQIKSGQGHDGSVVVGQILSMERTQQGIGNAYGVFDTGPYAKEAERLVRNGFIRGVSADMDQFEADEESEESQGASENDDSEKSKEIKPGRISITKARVMAVTIVPKPAFQECFIQIIEDKKIPQEDNVVQDGIYVEGVNPLDASALLACGMVASSIPLEPPASWFEDPKLKEATPLTVADDGRVFGHIAAWHVDHIGMSFGTKPPKSRSKYAYFHTGVVRTEEGNEVPVGQLTLAGGHASLEASAQEAVRHYDDTASAIADVHAGEDSFGIWVAGSLRPGVTPEQVRALRASAPSGDWRPIKGQLELVAVCQVNVPGFPIARARVASGQVMALVAAGAKVLAEMKNDPLRELNEKVEKLENAQKEPLIAAAEKAKNRVLAVNASILSKKQQELANRVGKAKKEIEDETFYMDQMFDEDPEKEMAVVSRKVRESLAKEGKALKDGSYPIRNVKDLKNAIQAYGRSKPSKRSEVRKHIIKRARSLKRADLIPDEWKSASSLDDISLYMREKAEFTAKSIALGAVLAAGQDEEDREILKDLSPEEIEALKQEKRQRDAMPERDEDGRIKYTPQTQPRDARGRFRLVLARLKSDLGVAGLNRVVEKVEEVENLDSAGDYGKSAKAADDLVGILNRLDEKALNPDSLENVRASARELGRAIANLPFAFGEDAQKVRFSDVPPALRSLMEDMVEKVEQKIGKEDAEGATEKLRTFMSGGDYFNQSEISSEMSKLLRLLT